MRFILIFLVRAYQRVLSPWLGNQCRFYPTCSQYALDALRQHGAFLGGLLVLGRIARCQPWCEGGEDTVPSHWHVRWMCACHHVDAVVKNTVDVSQSG